MKILVNSKDEWIRIIKKLQKNDFGNFDYLSRNILFTFDQKLFDENYENYYIYNRVVSSSYSGEISNNDLSYNTYNLDFREFPIKFFDDMYIDSTSIDNKLHIRTVSYSMLYNNDINYFAEKFNCHDDEIYIRNVNVKKDSNIAFEEYKVEIFKDLLKLPDVIPQNRDRIHIREILPKVAFDNRDYKEKVGSCIFDFQYHLKYEGPIQARVYMDYLTLRTIEKNCDDKCELYDVCSNGITKVIINDCFNHR